MNPSLYAISSKATGALFIMPKPSGDWLDDDLNKLKMSGVDRIVSMLMPEEAKDLGLAGEADACFRAGLDFTNVPVPDRELPGLEVTREIVQSIQRDLERSKGVAVHCRAGIGRSGLIACCVLIGQGVQANEALDLVSSARGVPVPDTDEQRHFVQIFTV